MFLHFSFLMFLYVFFFVSCPPSFLLFRLHVFFLLSSFVSSNDGSYESSDGGDDGDWKVNAAVGHKKQEREQQQPCWPKRLSRDSHCRHGSCFGRGANRFGCHSGCFGCRDGCFSCRGGHFGRRGGILSRRSRRFGRRVARFSYLGGCFFPP